MDDTLGDAVDRAVAANELHRPVEVGPEVVTRPAGEHTATVHAYLRHLRAQGLECVPEIGQHTDQGLASAARLLRRIHDAGSGWTPPADAVWGAAALTGESNVYCHGDPGPWNFIWHDNEAVALIDWDYLHPAPRLDDVAYALRWFAPLRSDEHALEWHHFPEVPDRAARVRTFIEAYGDLPAFDVVDAVTERIRAVVALMCDLAERGVEPQRTWVADGAAERDLEEIAWIEEHRDELATSRD